MSIENQDEFLASRRSRNFEGDYTEDEFAWWMKERERRAREERRGFPDNSRNSLHPSAQPTDRQILP